MHKINDVIITPKGLARIDRKNRNGLVKLVSVGNSDHSWYVRKAEIERYPPANRAVPTDLPTSQTRVYRAWRTLLRKPVLVCQEWLEYPVFAAWYKAQTADRPGGVKWVLEKLLDPSADTYGPTTACLVPQQISTAFRFRIVDRDLPLGVSKDRDGVHFVVHCGNKLIGRYGSVEMASDAYWSVKIRSIRALAVKYWNHLPEPLAMRLILFDRSDVAAYFPTDTA